MTTDELADEITTLAGHINAAMARWLELVGEFDAREAATREWGCKSTAFWIAWRCSIEPGAARQHVRVARRLRELPAIAAAFARGELSYSKVRALTRIENIEREDELIGMAQSSTAAQLERIVRGYRTVAAADAMRAFENRYVKVSYDDDGSVLIKGRLPAEEGAVVVKALEAARDKLFAEQHAAARATAADGSAEPPPAGGVTAGVRDAWQPDGAGVPPAATTLAERNADALVQLADAMLAAPDLPGRSVADRFQVVVHVDADALDEPQAADSNGSGAAGRCETEHDGQPVAHETARRLCCDGSLVGLVERDGRTLSVGRKTRKIPPSVRRALRNRDCGCRFPGCTQTRNVDAHHIEHWINGGETKLTNLVELCGYHHRLVHEGGYSVEQRRSSGRLVFRCPDGRVLKPAPRLPRGDRDCIAHENRQRGLGITERTTVPRWYGERLDLPLAVDAVLHAAPVPDRTPEAVPVLA